MARKAFRPQSKQRGAVEFLVGLGTPERVIAALIGISEPTLRKHFRQELDLGFEKLHIFVKTCLVEKIRAGDGPCTMFYLKTQCGWREKHSMEISGPNDGPVKVSHEIDLSKLSDRELATARGLVRKALAD